MIPKPKHSPGRPVAGPLANKSYQVYQDLYSGGKIANNICMSITINRQLLDRLDAARGDMTRSMVVRAALERLLHGETDDT